MIVYRSLEKKGVEFRSETDTEVCSTNLTFMVQLLEVVYVHAASYQLSYKQL
jgi:glucosamine 6-phosphate synthetase-like amidotransferase/phosphosugar isomerase protein